MTPIMLTIQMVSESIQIAGFLTLLLVNWRNNSPFTKGVLAWFIVSLAYDVGIWHCVRPHYVAEIYNYFINVVLGWGVLYDNYKQIFRRALVFLLSLFM